MRLIGVSPGSPCLLLAIPNSVYAISKTFGEEAGVFAGEAACPGLNPVKYITCVILYSLHIRSYTVKHSVKKR